MRLELSPASCVRIDLRAAGLLRAVGHDPTLVARPEPTVLEIPEGDVDVSVHARFPVEAIEPPADIDASDRDKMRDALRGREVLDAARFPTIDLAARYAGTTERGRLDGELRVRGVGRPLSMEIRVAREGLVLQATGVWQGRLTDLGIKPFKALMGALRLEDWVRLRLDANLAQSGGHV